MTAAGSSGRLLRPQMENDIRLLAGRDPNSLAPFGNAPFVGRANIVLPFRERCEPEAALTVGVDSLKMVAFASLRCNVRSDHRLAIGRQHLARDRAQPGRVWRSTGAHGQRRAQKSADQ